MTKSIFTPWTGAAFIAGIALGFSMKTGCRPDDACVRAWISATSGWAAAVAATIAAIVTLGPLRKQADEARRQTAFLVGNEFPFIDAVRHFEEPGEIVVTVTNWNRRNVLVSKAVIEPFENSTQLWAAEMDGNGIARGMNCNFNPPIAIKGWTDRSNSPHVLKLNLQALGGDGHSVLEWGDNPQVKVRVQVVGDGQQPSEVIEGVLVLD